MDGCANIMKTLLWLLGAALFCFLSPSVGAKEYEDVSMVQLIANPEKYDGTAIQVIGFVGLEPEGTAVYLHKEDHENGLTRNALGLDVSDEILKERKKYDRKYVIIRGTFNAKSKGHLSMNSGTIENITRFDSLGQPRRK